MDGMGIKQIYYMRALLFTKYKSGSYDMIRATKAKWHMHDNGQTDQISISD